MIIINQKENYTLYKPRHHWDMNYYLVDNENEVAHLIDINDVVSTVQELEELNACILWDEFKQLDDIENIKQCAWKTIQKES